jgi:hypothetical protein
MNVLLAVEFAAGRFQKVLTFAARKDGGGSLAAKWSGSLESGLARQAARFFAAEPAARQVEYAVCGKTFRAIRY